MRRRTLAGLMLFSLAAGVVATLMGKKNYPDGLQGSAATLPTPEVTEEDNARLVTPTPESPTDDSAVPQTPTPVFEDGTYTGDPIDTDYGTVQVEVTVLEGQLTSASAVQSPDTTPEAISNSEIAVPQLNQNVISAQSADIAGVVGATTTSLSYRDSLQSALDQASIPTTGQ